MGLVLWVLSLYITISMLKDSNIGFIGTIIVLIIVKVAVGFIARLLIVFLLRYIWIVIIILILIILSKK